MALKKLLLLGTKYTMQSDYYQKEFNQNNIEVITPSPTEQEELNKYLLEELVRGIFKIETKHRILQIVEKYSVEGVILGCTEFPLLIKQTDTSLILLDTLDIHAQATLDYALK